VAKKLSVGFRADDGATPKASGREQVR
jgi:hypothetical protein